ncbi:hypothetical protein [Pseudonocardia sp.]|jgi:hypothetical protein|uniref:hypothetical protein n=1 Tax=Pseudonocardia sp. TaxID=60912 RepID=UPI0031FCB55B
MVPGRPGLCLGVCGLGAEPIPLLAPISQAQHADLSAQSFQDAYSNSKSVWSGEKADLQELGRKMTLPGLGDAISDARHLGGNSGANHG